MTVTPHFDAASEEALERIADRLAQVARQYGPKDFPEDRGVGFRNALFGYPYTLFEVMKFFMEERPEDGWVLMNAHCVMQLPSEELMHVAGHCHFCVTARQAHFALLNTGSVNAPYLGKQFDWLFSTYGLTPHLAKQWFSLVTTVVDNDSYWDRAYRLLYKDIAYALSTHADDRKRAESWNGIAMAADLARPSRFGLQETEEDRDWHNWCNQLFSES